MIRKSGAYARNRTGDLILTKDALYQLSYVGITVLSHSELKRTALFQSVMRH